MQTILIQVSDEEFNKLLELKKGPSPTWRELFLKPLGIETERKITGPQRRRLVR